MNGERREGGEAFLDRWSRLKREQETARERDGEAPGNPAPLAPDSRAPTVLPAVDTLTPESDFTPFMAREVDPATRRDALKKLFADAHFNTPDPFEAYSEDYTKAESIPEAMLKTLNQARRILTPEKEAPAEGAVEQAAEAAPPPTSTQDVPDGPGRQDA